MKRKKILWLCSWYPSAADPFNGDFIQRHAKAAALYNDIHVIYVGGSKFIEDQKINSHDNTLTEQVMVYKSKKGLAGKLFNHLKWSRLFKMAVRNYIVKNGKPDLVHVHVPVKAGLIAEWVKKQYRVPYVVSEHWGIYNDVLIENYLARPLWFRRLTEKIFSNALKFSSVSDYLAAGVKKYTGIYKEYTVIKNTVDTSLFYYKPEQSTRFRFIHVSNMVPLKNAEGIIRAFAALNKTGADAELVLAGDKENTLHRLSEAFGLLNRSVFFKGEIPYAQVAEEMQKADCLILFSNIENSPCVIGEALCCGLPVIATKTGGIPELVNASNSILVETGNIKQLQEAMQKILKNNSAYNKTEIAESAKAIFSYPVIGRQFDELYKSAGPASM